MEGSSGWVGEAGFARRPIVVIEDHLSHVEDLLALLATAAPTTASTELAAQLTVLCLDRPGPDTRATARRWLASFPQLQVAAALGLPGSSGSGDDLAPAERARALDLPAEVFTSAHRYARLVAGLVRAGGLLLPDIQLSTLAFLPAERWWESIVLASTVRGMFLGDPPACRFLSNKRGYEATFGADLLEAGFHPRDVIDKNELATTVLPVLAGFLARTFPLELTARDGTQALPRALVRTAEADRAAVEAELDLALWVSDRAVEVGGRQLASLGIESRRLSLKPGSHEAQTWSALVGDRLSGGGGVAVIEVGRRVAPDGAERAEQTNLAARHLHGLRARLAEPAAIVTADHAYRLRDDLRVGRIAPRAKPE